MMSEQKEKYINPLTNFGMNAYEESLKYYRDIKNVVDTSREEGLKEGIKEGLKEGLKEGFEKRNFEIAKEMKANGEPIEKIMKYTNLTRKEIETL